MIILRYLIAEVFKSQIAVFLVFMAIFMSQTFVRVLADASEGKIPGYLVASIIGLRFPQFAAIILPLSVFLGVMLAFGRLYTDQEMSVLKATGVSEWYVTRVTLVFAFIVALFGGAITLYLAPMSAEYEHQVRENAAAEGVLSTLTAGSFQKAGSGNSVVFVHEIERNQNQMKKVFVAQATDEGVKNVVYAQNGQLIEHETGDQDLVLTSGQRYSLEDTPSRLTFSQYQIAMETQAIEKRRRNLPAVPTADLMQSNDRQAMAELQWRLAIPLTIPILAMIAVPLSAVNPRQGRFGKMLPGLGLFFGYYILLILAKSALEDGKIPQQVGLWWIHLLGLLIASLLLLRERSAGGRIRHYLLEKLSRRGASNV